MRDKIDAVSLRPTPDPEIAPLVRAIKARIEGLGAIVIEQKDKIDVYLRDKVPFLQLELKRDHMSLDLWMPLDQLDESRASGIARAHPFLGDDAVKIRFERAEDLSRIARWIEASYAYAPDRERLAAERAKKPAERDPALVMNFQPHASSRPSHAASHDASVSSPSAAAVLPSKHAKAGASAEPAKKDAAPAAKPAKKDAAPVVAKLAKKPAPATKSAPVAKKTTAVKTPGAQTPAAKKAAAPKKKGGAPKKVADKKRVSDAKKATKRPAPAAKKRARRTR